MIHHTHGDMQKWTVQKMALMYKSKVGICNLIWVFIIFLQLCFHLLLFITHKKRNYIVSKKTTIERNYSVLKVVFTLADLKLITYNSINVSHMMVKNFRHITRALIFYILVETVETATLELGNEPRISQKPLWCLNERMPKPCKEVKAGKIVGETFERLVLLENPFPYFTNLHIKRTQKFKWKYWPKPLKFKRRILQKSKIHLIKMWVNSFCRDNS